MVCHSVPNSTTVPIPVPALPIPMFNPTHTHFRNSSPFYHLNITSFADYNNTPPKFTILSADNLRDCHGYRKTCEFEVMGLAGTGMVVDFDTL